jgi:hypothetical protein
VGLRLRLLRFQQWLQHFGEDFRLPHEAQIVGVRTIGAALAVVAVKVFAFDVVRIL